MITDAPNIYIVIPTYNEAKNLTSIATALFSLDLPNLKILVIDDNSPDGTGQIADQLSNKYTDRLWVIHRQGKLGLGTAYLQGFRWALQNGADYVIHMDADFSHNPKHIVEFLERVPGYDVVIGSRYTTGGKIDERWSVWRRLLSWWANSVWVRIILGIQTQDATAGFRCWTRTALEQIELERVNANGYVFHVEMCYIAERLELKILEIPIYFADRSEGQSKMDRSIQLEAALRVFEIWWRHRKIKPRMLLTKGNILSS